MCTPPLLPDEDADGVELLVHAASRPRQARPAVATRARADAREGRRPLRDLLMAISSRPTSGLVMGLAGARSGRPEGRDPGRPEGRRRYVLEHDRAGQVSRLVRIDTRPGCA